MNFGFIKSELDGTEPVYKISQAVPEEFQYELKDVIDQGDRPICTACSVDTFLSWQYNKNFDKEEIFKGSDGTENGAQFINVMKYLNSKDLIDSYAVVPSVGVLKTAIYLNGPCVGGLMVKSMNSDFWNGNQNYGGHAISLIGWTKDSFIIRNSWGKDWGDKGLTYLPFKNFNKLIECWTLIK